MLREVPRWCVQINCQWTVRWKRWDSEESQAMEKFLPRLAHRFWYVLRRQHLGVIHFHSRFLKFYYLHLCWNASFLDIKYTSLAILCDLFGMVKWPFKWLSDLQLGDQKVTAWITRSMYGHRPPAFPSTSGAFGVGSPSKIDISTTFHGNL